MRYTIDRKSWYNFVAGEFTEEDFAKVCNLSAKAVRSELYDKKLEFDAIFEAQVELIERLGNSLTLDKIKAAITGVDTSKDASFFSVWQDRINFFRTNNNGEQYTTAESYECAMKSFRKILWDRPITGFKVGKEDIEYWSNGMQNGVLNENGELIGQIREATRGLYLRNCRAVWNECVSRGYLTNQEYPFSNVKKKNLVAIPVGDTRKDHYLNVQQMTELYRVFIEKRYPEKWKKGYAEKAHYSLGLFLVQYLCNGFNMADAAELAALSKRIMLSAIHALPEIFVKLREQIHAGSNPLLMCTLYFVCIDHGLPRSAMALSKVSLGAKQISYIRESVKDIVEKLMETSVTNALDKKAEWTKQIKDVEDAELKQAMKGTLNNTKGKHGRRTFQQEEQSIDDILIADDKQALKEAILMALNDMEHEYETAYIKAALIRSHHLEPHISFSVFLRAISAFSGRVYKYDPAQRVDTVIYREEKKFMTSKNSKWQRGRRIVSYLVEIFDAIQ